jgi:hypothetical protein
MRTPFGREEAKPFGSGRDAAELAWIAAYEVAMGVFL